MIEDPALIKTAVEEMLRFESSNQLGNRMTVEPFELGGVALPAGTPVTLCIGAANRDPAHSPIPNVSISAVRRTGIWLSAPAHINAPEWRWRGSRAIAISRFCALSGLCARRRPVRGGRVRFRGFLSVPCEVG